MSDETGSSNIIDETNKNKIDEGKSNSQVEVDMEESHVKAKASLQQKKSVKEVLLIDIYGAEDPQSGYSATTVPVDRPRLTADCTRQTRRFRSRIQAFFMSPQEGGSGGMDYKNADPATRNIFVQKVFGLVFIMLLITALFVAFAYTSDELKNMFRDRSIKIPVLGASMVLMFLSCIVPSDCARVPPCNYICLLLAVMCMSFIGATVTCRYTALSVLLALLITAGIVLMCLALACTQFDFTQFLIYIMAAFAVLALCSIVYMILRMCDVYVPAMHMILLVVGSLLQTFMIIIELQMILGGKAAEISESDYALGAFMLYTSIIQLFLNILQLIGETD